MDTIHTKDLDYILSDSGNADRLVEENLDDFKYCNALGGWLHWSGLRWQVDNDAIWETARGIGNTLLNEAASELDRNKQDRIIQHARYSLRKSAISSMVELATHDSRLKVDADLFDADPYLLNVENGTVDLRTGEIKDHNRNDLITKLAHVAYDPDAHAPIWTQFLEKILPQEELRNFIQKAIGYSATGDVSEHCLLIMYGRGANGKSTFIEAIRNVIGDYAYRTRTESLMISDKGNGPTPDIAKLKGKRFVTASESSEGDYLAESLVKDITGGDTINARHMYSSPFEFTPTHTLWLSTNHKPQISGTDHGIWRRMHLIPFTVSVPKHEQDKQLSQKLQDELSGILAWLIQGATAWYQDQGLNIPKEIQAATDEYRSEMDDMEQFVNDECVTGSWDYTARKQPLYDEYKQWCSDNGKYPKKYQRFRSELTDRGFVEDTQGKEGKKVWKGIGLLANYPQAVAAVAAVGDIGNFSLLLKNEKSSENSDSADSADSQATLSRTGNSEGETKPKPNDQFLRDDKTKPDPTPSDSGHNRQFHITEAVAERYILHFNSIPLDANNKAADAIDNYRDDKISIDEAVEALTRNILHNNRIDPDSWRQYQQPVRDVLQHMKSTDDYRLGRISN